MKRQLTIHTLAIAGAMLALSASAWEWDWHWGMPGEVYKQLDFQSRSGVDRANKLFGQAWENERRGARSIDLVPQYRAAAGEWRKVQLQAETQDSDENLLAYAVFMQGFAKMKSHDRNESMKLFNEVLDLYEDTTWVAFAAKYWIASSKIDMGDLKSGWRMLEELADEGGEAEKHALMGNVLNRVGWKKWGEFREAEAQDLWLRGVNKVFCENNRRCYDSCREGLHLACAVRADFAVFEDSIFEGVKEENHKRRADIVRDNANWLRNELNNWNSRLNQYFNGKYKDESKRKDALKKFRKNLIGWYESRKGEFVADKREFEFDVLNIRMHFGYEAGDQIRKRIQTLVNQLAGLKDDDQRNGRINAIISLYHDIGERVEPIYLCDRLRPATYAAWRRYELTWDNCHNRVKDFAWDDCLKILKEYQSLKPDPAGLKKSKYAMAGLYRDKLGKSELAVPIYLDLAEPPGTLWDLVYCYRNMKEKAKAEMTLNEIASMFKNEAPQAVWKLAEYSEQDGDKKKAIALYRRLLSQPEWKTTQQSSWAHQALERLGERTGGAMTNEVR